jgi:hypothetical protein
MKEEDLKEGLPVRNIKDAGFIGAQGKILDTVVDRGWVKVNYSYIPNSSCRGRYWTRLSSLSIAETPAQKNKRLLEATK